MQMGKLSESVLKRSVLRKLHKGISPQCREYYGMDCAFFHIDGMGEGRTAGVGGPDVFSGMGACTSVSAPPGFERMPGSLAVVAANSLYAGGAVPAGLMVQALLPLEYEETALQADMEAIAEGARAQGLKIFGGHTQVTADVREAVYTATGIGYAVCGKTVEDRLGYQKSETEQKFEIPVRRLPEPGDELVLTKWIALGGTAAFVLNYEKELKGRYPFALIDRAKEFEKLMSVACEARAVNHFGTAAVHDLSQGGVFGGLWELAERAGVGLEVDLRKIPVKQETIEICEYFDVNPYELYSAGSLLISTERGEAMVRELAHHDIPATVIGRVTGEAGRIIRNGEDTRYLDRPKQDGWYHFQQNMEDMKSL